MADHLRADLSVPAVARRAGMSARNFARVFTRSVGMTPARLVERLRVEAARRRLEESDSGVEAVAADCGFGSAESMRCAFMRTLRVPPSAYRSRFVLAALAGCTDSGYDVPLPPDFPALPVPADNELTAARVALGKRLFYDPQLSRTREVSCASCHVAEHAFADPRRFSVGVDGHTGTRNAPSLVNVAYETSFFWDGGAPTLEQQAIGPITNPLEMDMKLDDVVARLSRDPDYVAAFEDAYGAGPSPGGVTRALAAFERTIVGGGSRYDRYQRGDRTALTDEALVADPRFRP